MAEVEDWLHKTVPEIRYIAAHGQMAPAKSKNG
jgi:transcription-repair coupling factor (superfamily II helicase)